MVNMDICFHYSHFMWSISGFNQYPCDVKGLNFPARYSVHCILLRQCISLY